MRRLHTFFKGLKQDWDFGWRMSALDYRDEVLIRMEVLRHVQRSAH